MVSQQYLNPDYAQDLLAARDAGARQSALALAIQNNPGGSTEDIVKAAKEFYKFMTAGAPSKAMPQDPEQGCRLGGLS